MTRLSYFFVAALLLLCAGVAATASAKGNHKAAASDAKAEAGPAVSTESAGSQPGTTIIGEDESPVGLYITPWKNGYAERGLARSQPQLEEFPSPIDPDTFHRQNVYYDTITAYRKAELEDQSGSTAPQSQSPAQNP